VFDEEERSGTKRETNVNKIEKRKTDLVKNKWVERTFIIINLFIIILLVIIMQKIGLLYIRNRDPL